MEPLNQDLNSEPMLTTMKSHCCLAPTPSLSLPVLPPCALAGVKQEGAHVLFGSGSTVQTGFSEDPEGWLSRGASIERKAVEFSRCSFAAMI